MKILRSLVIGLACAAGWGTSSAAGEPAQPPTLPAPVLTFTKDIAPLVFEHCASCHWPGGSAPFSLLTYADVKPRVRQVAAAVARRSMPPWKPEPGYGDFVGARRLSDDQIGRFALWVQQGSLDGSPADLPPAPADGDDWQLGPPDMVLRIGSPYRLSPSGADRIRNFVIPIPGAVRRYVKAWEFRTNAPRVVHHATMVLDPTPASRRLDDQDPEAGYEGLIPLSAQNPDGYFLGWTPGQSPSASPDDMAWRIDAGSDLVLMLHLKPSGQWESIEVTIGLHFSDAPPSRIPAMVRLNRQDQDIPAGEPRYIAHDRYTLPVDVDAYSVQPHAHNLAREVKAFATLPDGTTKSLLSIRDWDFHWQDLYRYRQPVFLPAGTELSMEFVYDNSAQNRANPNSPPRRVTFGQRTTEEMGDVWLQVVPRHATDLAPLVASLGRKLLPQNIQGYQTLLRSDPDNAGLHDDLALLKVEAGDLEGAAEEFRQSLRLRPEAASSHYNLGNALLLVRRFSEAATRFRAAIDLSPRYGLAHLGLALSLEADGRLEEAAVQFAVAVQVMPTADVHYNFGVLRQRQTLLESALGEYREALRISPDYAAAHFGSGLVHASLGRSALAVASFRSALAVRPDWPAAQLELAWTLATCPDAGVRNPAEAVALATRVRATGAGPGAHVLDVLAAALAAAGRFEEAAATAGEALLALSPNDSPPVRDEIQSRLGRYLARQSYQTPVVAPP